MLMRRHFEALVLRRWSERRVLYGLKQSLLEYEDVQKEALLEDRYGKVYHSVVLDGDVDELVLHLESHHEMVCLSVEDVNEQAVLPEGQYERVD